MKWLVKNSTLQKSPHPNPLSKGDGLEHSPLLPYIILKKT